ncbi:MAG: DUF2141 domain-containing protein [Pseudomonadota bacterium]
MKTTSTGPIAAGLGALALLAGSGAVMTSSLSAQSGYANVISNNMSRCAPGKGPAVRLTISGLRNGNGNLYVRTYKATSRDWLKAKRYLTRVNARPRKGTTVVCVPIPAEGNYAIAVQHDINGNQKTDFTIDGGGISNNVKIGRFLGIPRPPSVKKAAFRVGSGVRRLSISVLYP